MLRKPLAVAALGGLLALPLLARPAMADTTSSTSSSTSVAPRTTRTAPRRDADDVKRRCTVAIDVRLAELAKLDARIDAARRLTAAHKTAMRNANAAARAGLNDLKAKIAADVDAGVLKTDCQSIVLDYRIFALRVPQEHLVIAADAESAAITRLQALDPKLSDAIGKAETNGTDVTAAKAAFADYEAKVADAAKLVTGLADTVLAYQPGDYNANHAVLKPARTSIKSASADLNAARPDATTIVTTLKSAKATKK